MWYACAQVTGGCLKSRKSLHVKSRISTWPFSTDTHSKLVLLDFSRERIVVVIKISAAELTIHTISHARIRIQLFSPFGLIFTHDVLKTWKRCTKLRYWQSALQSGVVGTPTDLISFLVKYVCLAVTFKSKDEFSKIQPRIKNQAELVQYLTAITVVGGIVVINADVIAAADPVVLSHFILLISAKDACSWAISFLIEFLSTILVRLRNVVRWWIWVYSRRGSDDPGPGCFRDLAGQHPCLANCWKIFNMDEFGVDFGRSMAMYFRSVLNRVTVWERAWDVGGDVKTHPARIARNESLLFCLDCLPGVFSCLGLIVPAFKYIILFSIYEFAKISHVKKYPEK